MNKDDPNPGHEVSDVHARGLAWFGAWLMAVLAAILIVVAWMDKRLNHAGTAWPRQPMAAASQFVAPAPELQASPREELRLHAAHDKELLNSYGWIDRKQGVIHIPISRAMELILQRGLPATGGTMPLPGPDSKNSQGDAKP